MPKYFIFDNNQQMSGLADGLAPSGNKLLPDSVW